MKQKSPIAPQVILLVEDDELFARAMTRALRKVAKILVAGTVLEAQTLFEAHPEITLVIMDANVPFTKRAADVARLDKRLMTTMELTRAIRAARPDLVMVTSSSSEESRKRLVEAGCNFDSPKEEVIRFVLDLLKKS